MMEIGNAPDRLQRFFGPGHRAAVEPLPAGGLSGSRVWRVVHEGDPYALRCSPAGRPGPEHTAWVHRCMASVGVSFVPRPIATQAGPSCFEEAEGVWELQTWMPGAATLDEDSPDGHICAAVEAVSQLHDAWSKLGSQRAPSPTLQKRAQGLDRLNSLGPAAADPRSAHQENPFEPECAQMLDLFPRAAATARTALGRVQHTPRRLHPVVIDLKQDHILFTGDRVTGIVDYAAMGIDTPAVDWARLIGSVAGDNPALWRRWTEAVSARLPDADAADLGPLLRALDASGTVLSTANWLRWLSEGWRPPAGGELLVRRRLAWLGGRLRTLACI